MLEKDYFFFSRSAVLHVGKFPMFLKMALICFVQGETECTFYMKTGRYFSLTHFLLLDRILVIEFDYLIREHAVSGYADTSVVVFNEFCFCCICGHFEIMGPLLFD